MRTTHVLIASILLSCSLAPAPQTPSTVAPKSNAAMVPAAPPRDPGPACTEPEHKALVEELFVSVQRPVAVHRIEKLFEDNLAQAEGDRSKPSFQKVSQCMVPHVLEAYLTTHPDEHDALALMKVLAGSADVRALPAWRQAIRTLKRGEGEPQASMAVRAIADAGVRDPEVLKEIGEAYLRMEAGYCDSARATRTFYEAMRDIAAPAWEPMLLERLARPMVIPSAQNGDEQKSRIYHNELFWQLSAAEVLGELKSTAAVKPLLKCTLDPNKAELASAAQLSLVSLGKPAIPVLAQLLKGSDKELNDFAASVVRSEPKEAIVRQAGLALGAIGHADCAVPLVDAIGRTKDPATRALLARELANLPSSPTALKGYIDVLFRLSPTVRLPSGERAAAMLTEAAQGFYDPSQIDMLLRRAQHIVGSDDDKRALREATVVTAMRLMKLEQALEIERTAQAWGLQTEAFAQCKDVLNACGAKAECYLAKLQDPAAPEAAALKAATMLGVIGNDPLRRSEVRTGLLRALPGLQNAAVKSAAARALDHITPKAEQEVTDGLKGDLALRQVMLRIAARK